jgi:hypothetical protein
MVEAATVGGEEFLVVPMEKMEEETAVTLRDTYLATLVDTVAMVLTLAARVYGHLELVVVMEVMVVLTAALFPGV